MELSFKGRNGGIRPQLQFVRLHVYRRYWKTPLLRRPDRQLFPASLPAALLASVQRSLDDECCGALHQGRRLLSGVYPRSGFDDIQAAGRLLGHHAQKGDGQRFRRRCVRRHLQEQPLADHLRRRHEQIHGLELRQLAFDAGRQPCGHHIYRQRVLSLSR